MALRFGYDRSMSSFDIYAILNEIKRLENSIIDNVYQYNDLFGLKVRTTSGPVMLLVEPSRRIHITSIDYSWEATNFVKMIRKHINRKRIVRIDQYRFDRIVEISMDDDYKIIAEILTRGNFVITRNQKILFAYKHVHMRDRSIYPGAPFQYPPGGPTIPISLTLEEFSERIKDSKNLLLGISKLGLGKKYAYEICYRCGISNPEKVSYEALEAEDLESLFNCIVELFDMIRSGNVAPRVYFLENKLYSFSPIRLKCLEEIGAEQKTFRDFSAALDFYFSRLEIEPSEKETVSALRAEKEKLVRRIQEQQKRILELKNEIEKLQQKIQLLYENAHLLTTILETIKHARIDLDLSWDEIERRIKMGKEKGMLEAKLIEKITKEGKIIVKLGENSFVELDIKKSLHDLAKEYYEKIKKFESKIKTAEEELQKSLLSLESIEKILLENLKIESIIVKHPPRKWYDSFRWFVSSDGFLIVAGKDAQSNERLVKRYMETNDVFLHAEIHGGAVVLIKNPENRSIPSRTLYEAAVFAASYSKAWQRGFSAIDVFWTTPEYVSFTPPSGQYLAPGAFIIKRKNYLKNIPLKIAIGISLDAQDNEVIARIFSAPPEVIKSHTKYFVTLVPGSFKKSETAKQIMTKLKSLGKNDVFLLKVLRTLKIEKIIELIPGPSQILEVEPDG